MQNLVRKPQGKGSVQRTKHCWDDRIKRELDLTSDLMTGYVNVIVNI
jgi:hypothetical protein